MPFSLSELLNPALSPHARLSSPSHQGAAEDCRASAPSTFSAAVDMSTALAQAHGDGASEHWSRRGDDAPAPHLTQARRQSNRSFAAMPVEPLPPSEERQHTCAPTLERYHHRPTSPEEQRRRSQYDSVSSDTRLPPIRTLAAVSTAAMEGEHANEQPLGHGHDDSHMISDLQTQANGLQSTDADLPAREPDFVRDEPTTSQIRQPSSTASALAAAEPLSLQYDGHRSPLPQIKSEPVGTPRAISPGSDAAMRKHDHSVSGTTDEETLRALESLQNEHGLRSARRDSTAAASVHTEHTTETKTTTAPPKKRAAKKGVAKKPATATKRRKTNAEGAAGARRGSTSTVKGTSKKSHSATPATGSSPGPYYHGSSPGAHDDYSDDEGAGEGESGTEGGVFCICRGPDDHTWMIGCDGGCDDWFHGRCVGLNKEEHERLIERYICPNCEREGGKGTTTLWKRMCRRLGCRKPARLGREKPSKYCSDECGQLFFKEILAAQSGGKGGLLEKGGQLKKRSRKKSSAAAVDHTIEDEQDEDDFLPSRGGPLRPAELKALIAAVPEDGINEFRALGTGVLSPGSATLSPSKPADADAKDSEGDRDTARLTPAEAARIAAIGREKEALRARHGLLRDRVRFAELAVGRIPRVAAREGMKPTEPCGFDARLAWPDEVFDAWRRSEVGRRALRVGGLEGEGVDGVEGEGDRMDVDGEEQEREREEEGDAAAAPTVCTKKRCQKHPMWPQVHVNDCRFEQALAIEQVRKLEAEEREIRERATVRWRKEVVAGELEGEEGGRRGEEMGVDGGGDGERMERMEKKEKGKKDREGWVEVVGVL